MQRAAGEGPLYRCDVQKKGKRFWSPSTSHRVITILPQLFSRGEAAGEKEGFVLGEMERGKKKDLNAKKDYSWGCGGALNEGGG